MRDGSLRVTECDAGPSAVGVRVARGSWQGGVGARLLERIVVFLGKVLAAERGIGVRARSEDQRWAQR